MNVTSDRTRPSGRAPLGNPEPQGELGIARLPIASVVIPTRRRPDLLSHQLRSLGAQDFQQDWEVIVADNAGDECTATVVASFARTLPSVHSVDASGLAGGGPVRNEGARHARGRYLLFLDDDDEAGPGFLRAMVDALHEYAFVAARLDHTTLNHNWVARALEPWQTDRLLDVWGFLPHASGCALGIRREVFEGVGGWRGGMPHSDDVEFCWDVQLAGTSLHLAEGAVVHYRHRTSALAYLSQEWRSGVADLLLYARFGNEGMPQPTPGWGQPPAPAFLASLLKLRSAGDALVWLGALVRRVSRMLAIRAYRRGRIGVRPNAAPRAEGIGPGRALEPVKPPAMH